MSKLLTTFAQPAVFEQARAQLDALGIGYDVLRPEPAFARVGAPCVIMDDTARMVLAEHDVEHRFSCSGWVACRDTTSAIPQESPPAYTEDVFGRAAVMVLAPCVADLSRIRLTAHLSGNLGKVFPYLNREMREGSYTPGGPTFTFMDKYRMVCLYPGRITMAKANDIVDAWAVLERIRRRVNEVWQRRATITPSYERRERPPALEIYKRLPGSNCKECGELTCLAFAARLWRGETTMTGCRPVFSGTHTHLRQALVDICVGLGLTEEAS
jgi:ArsR family metal-binding transcriptional regulator